MSRLLRVAPPASPDTTIGAYPDTPIARHTIHRSGHTTHMTPPVRDGLTGTHYEGQIE